MRTKSGGWYSYASTIINVRISYPDAVIAEATDVGWPASPSATALSNPQRPTPADPGTHPGSWGAVTDCDPPIRALASFSRELTARPARAMYSAIWPSPARRLPMLLVRGCASDSGSQRPRLRGFRRH
jgi:hypothetical protein